MTTENPAALWAKQHRREFVKALVEASGAEPQNDPTAIFMAGLPGAGKTELSKNIIDFSKINFVRIDMDEIASQIENYDPKEADRFRLGATTLLSEVFSYALYHNLDFIMDGTFGSPKAKTNIERTLKHGYMVKIIYTYQDPKTAWEFTKAREKIEHRAIKFGGFIKVYYNTLENLKKIYQEFHGQISIDIVVKTADNRIGVWYDNMDFSEIDEFVKLEYNKDKLIKYIKGE
ncbi:zeta toxin family protein [Candidatus Saccharibacteria bacterium]|nr:zeta toxin family protein [Candidatus Saccharibacteria bacterium]